MQIKFKSAWAIAALTFIAGIAGVALLGTDTQVPIHWTLDGEVDRTTSPLGALMLVPGIQLFILLIFSLLKYFEPRKENLQKSAKAIAATATAITSFMAMIETGLLLEAFGYHVFAGNYILVGLGVFLAILGNYMSKLRSGFFVGIRTPWTLSSETVWQKTHRLGGRLFVAAGILIALSALLLPPVISLKLMIGIVLITALLPVLYSWYAWRIEKNTQNP